MQWGVTGVTESVWALAQEAELFSVEGGRRDARRAAQRTSNLACHESSCFKLNDIGVKILRCRFQFFTPV